ncbi:MAG: phage tail protein, partial [Mesorhizobium sp.]
MATGIGPAPNSGEGYSYTAHTGYGTYRQSNTGYGQTVAQATATMRLWNGGYGADAKTAREQAEDGSSPLGEKIPKLVGTDMFAGYLIIDRDKFGGVKSAPATSGDGGWGGIFAATDDNGSAGGQWGGWGSDAGGSAPTPKLVTTLVLAFLQTDLAGPADMLELRCKDQVIFSSRAPKKSLKGLRIYRGDQTAPDPAVRKALGNRASCFPGLAYIVLENFDIAPFAASANDLPPFTAVWSSATTAQEASEDESTLIDDEPGGYQGVSAVDHGLNMAYQTVLTDSGAIVVTTDIRTQEEVRRAALPDFGYDYFYSLSALSGSDFVVGVCQNGAYQGLVLIDTRQGTAVRLAAQTLGSTIYEPAGIISSAMLSSGAATKYAIVCHPFVTGGAAANNDAMVALADVTNGTLQWIAGPGVAPVRSGAWQELQSWAWGPVGGGTATAFFCESGKPEIYRCQVTESGVSAVATVTSAASSSPTGLFYDAANNALVYTRADSHVVSYDLGTSVQRWDAALSTYGEMNSDEVVTQDVLRPGYMRISDLSGVSQLVDLSDGSASTLYDGSWPEAASYNQSKGWLVEPGSTSGTVLIVKFGDVTPDSVDAIDILTALATYNGDYDAADLTFAGFPGNECSGLAIRSDTTIAEIMDNVCATLGVRKVHDGGKLNFILPARDGSRPIDRVLGNDSLVQRGDTSIRQTQSDLDSAIESGALRFIDPDAGYIENTVRFSRPNSVFEVLASNRMEEFSTALVMTVAQASRQVERIVIDSEFQARQYELGLMPSELAVSPASTIQFPYGPNDEITVVAEVVQSDLHGDDFSQDIVALEFAQSIESTFVGSGLVTVAVQDVSYNLELVILDTALIRDADDTAG